MAQRGRPSIAHEYAANDQCIHCGMYRNVVEALSHVCKPLREAEVDAREAEKAGMTVRAWRLAAVPRRVPEEV